MPYNSYRYDEDNISSESYRLAGRVDSMINSKKKLSELQAQNMKLLLLENAKLREQLNDEMISKNDIIMKYKDQSINNGRLKKKNEKLRLKILYLEERLISIENNEQRSGHKLKTSSKLRGSSLSQERNSFQKISRSDNLLSKRTSLQNSPHLKNYKRLLQKDNMHMSKDNSLVSQHKSRRIKKNLSLDKLLNKKNATHRRLHSGIALWSSSRREEGQNKMKRLTNLKTTLNFRNKQQSLPLRFCRLKKKGTNHTLKKQFYHMEMNQ